MLKENYKKVAYGNCDIDLTEFKTGVSNPNIITVPINLSFKPRELYLLLVGSTQSVYIKAPLKDPYYNKFTEYSDGALMIVGAINFDEKSIKINRASYNGNPVHGGSGRIIQWIAIE